MKTVLGFTGSNSSKSINRTLLEHAQTKVRNLSVTLIDLRDFDAPIYSQDLEEQSGVPESIQRLRKLFDEHDAYMMASPEHNGMMPAFFKNIMDWLSRLEGPVFQHKPVMLMSTSPGPLGGQTNLANMKSVFPYWGASAVFADFHLGNFYQAFDPESKVFTDPEDEVRLVAAIRAFEEHVQKDPATA